MTISDKSASNHSEREPEQVSNSSAAAETGRASPKLSAFIVNPWLVRPELNQIEHQQRAEVRHLEPRLMRLLCILAANPGSVLERDRLMTELWPQVVVNENSLTRAVSDLRKLLHDSEGESRKLIQTIPKRGYRLQNAAVTVAPARGTAVELTTEPVRRFWRQAVGAAIAASLTLVTGIALISSGDPVLPSSEVRMADELVITDPNFQGGKLALSSTFSVADPKTPISEPVLSADGTRYAYIAIEPGGHTIYLGNRDTEMEPVAVYSSQEALTNLAWSPVGNALLFARSKGVKPAIIHSGDADKQDLLSLNLDNGRLSRLVESDDATVTPPVVNLTALDHTALPLVLKTRSGLPG